MSYLRRYPILFLSLIAISYLLLSLLYIYPAQSPFLSSDTTLVLSDGSDPVTFTYQFAFLKKTFVENPKELLFGSVFNPHMDAPYGVNLWIAQTERVIVIFLSFFLPVEQISTGLVLVYMTLDGFIMFLLARAMNIPNLVSWGMGCAWAFNAYTRARAKVHMGLVGIFHIPLVFLALIFVSKKKKSHKMAALVFFIIVASSSHYYVVTLAVFTPLLLAFAWIQRDPSDSKKKFVLNLFSLTVPAIAFLAYNLLVPVSPWSNNTAPYFPPTGMHKTDEYHPFLDRFGAKPIDYFTGDIAIGLKDPNPIKEILNITLAKDNYHNSFPHEVALGIRWQIWLLAFIALIYLAKKNNEIFSASDKKTSLLFCAFGVLSLLLSISPDSMPSGGPSLWLYRVIPQIRVPNRAGIGVSFSLIILAGLFLKSFFNSFPVLQKTKLYIAIAFAVLVIAEFPPLYQAMPMSNIDPVFKALTGNNPCGTGFLYPYASGQENSISYYYLLQRMRGSNCNIINSSTPSILDNKMGALFASEFVFNRLRKNTSNEVSLLKHFTNCSDITWIVFSPPLKKETSQGLCAGMKWNWHSDGVCINPETLPKMKKSIEDCTHEIY